MSFSAGKTIIWNMRTAMIITFWRAIQLFFLFAAPGSLIAASIGGIPLAAGWAAVTLLALFTLSLYSEEFLAKAHGASWNVAPGLAKSFEISCARSELAVPHLGVLPSAIPTAFVIRSTRGRGTVLVSQGLVALLPEEELRAVLHRCAAHTFTSGLALRSLSALLAYWAFKAAPRAWSELIMSDQSVTAVRARNLTAGRAVMFLIAFPLLNILLRMSQEVAGRPGLRVAGDSFFEQAVRLAQRHLLNPDSTEQSLSVRSLCIIPSQRPSQKRI